MAPFFVSPATAAGLATVTEVAPSIATIWKGPLFAAVVAPDRVRYWPRLADVMPDRPVIVASPLLTAEMVAAVPFGPVEASDPSSAEVSTAVGMRGSTDHPTAPFLVSAATAPEFAMVTELELSTLTIG